MLVAGTVVLFAAAYMTFMRQEVRADADPDTRHTPSAHGDSATDRHVTHE